MPDNIEGAVRCYFMRQGHIADVELLPGLNDDEAVQKSRELFEARKLSGKYEGYEVWDQARKIVQYPSPESSLAPRVG